MANKLFIPGPTHVRDEILAELTHGQIGHRTAEFRELFSSLKPGLSELFFTKNDVLISTSSGSGFWEAAIRNCVAKKVLHATNGAFSKKWSSISKSCGREVILLSYDFGKAVQASDVDRYLTEHDVEAFCMVHNETSTGVCSNLSEISKVMKKHPDVLWIVDAVSSLSGIKIDVDALGIDICLASSQKALALPAGIALASVSDRVYEKAKTVEGRGYYFDLLELKKMYDKDMTPYTPSIPHLYALKKQLDDMQQEGFENRFLRHRKMADFVRSWAESEGLAMFSEKGAQSDTVSCIVNTKNVDFSEIKKDMASKGYSIDSGYGKLNKELAEAGKPSTFRIPHMGDLTLEDMKLITKQFEEYWK